MNLIAIGDTVWKAQSIASISVVSPDDDTEKWHVQVIQDVCGEVFLTEFESEVEARQAFIHALKEWKAS